MIGSRNRNGIHFLLLENPAKVFFRRGRLAHFLLHTLGELPENIAVHVTHVRDAGSALVCFKGREMSVATAIQANHCKVEAIEGAEDPAIAPV